MNTQTTYLASKPHYEILDGLRGVAAVMVIVFHLFEAHAAFPKVRLIYYFLISPYKIQMIPIIKQ